MAGERKGLAYEAIVKVALDELTRRAAIDGSVYWNETPDGMTIEPDVTVGRHKDRPYAVCLVTHSGASGNSHMKFWRNMAELGEAKTRLTHPARVYSVAFDTIIKEDLKILQEVAFDGQLLVGDAEYGGALQAWAEELVERRTADRNVLLERVRSSAPSRRFWSQFVADMRRLLLQCRPNLDALWNGLRSRKTPECRDARRTSFKRGIAKLLIADDPMGLLRAAERNRPVSSDRLLEELGWVSNSVAGLRVVDPDIQFIAAANPSGTLTEVINTLRSKKSLSDMIRPLRDAEVFVGIARHLRDRWRSVCEPVWLFRELQRAHANPLGYASALGYSRATYVRPGVVAEALVELLKALGGGRQGFGLARLVALLEEQQSHRRNVEEAARAAGVREIAWRRANTVSYGYRDWLFGADRQNFGITSFEIMRIACALSVASASFDSGEVSDAIDGLREHWVTNFFESKVASHRDLDVLDQIVAAAFRRSRIPFERIPLFPCVWSELARDAREVAVNVRSGSTAVFRVHNSLVVTKSVTDEGRDHKRKELCGRAYALRFAWDCNRGTFQQRPGTEKMILVLDGTWDGSDLETLSAAGWDGIFYPDETEELIRAII